MGKRYLSHKEVEKDHETPFNMAMLFYLQLSDLMKRKNDAILNDAWDYGIETLEEIFTHISFKLDDEEYKHLENDLTELKTLGKSKTQNKTIKEYEFNEMKDKFRTINRNIMRLMDKYKMIFPRIDNVSNIDKMKKRYDISG